LTVNSSTTSFAFMTNLQKEKSPSTRRLEMYSQASPTVNSIDFTLLLYRAPCLPHGTGLKDYLVTIYYSTKHP